MSMLNLYPRLQLQQASSAADDTDENVDVDHHDASLGYGYGIAVVCVTIFLFCVLVTYASVWMACAFAALAAALLIVAGCFAPKRWFRGSQPSASAELVVTVVTAAGAARRPGYPHPCLRVNVPPAFAFECPAALVEAGGGGGEPAAVAPAASCLVCSVCLEDVRGGEMVRQLKTCRHIFHVGCIDMWLHSHRTCPMCRCVISPVATATTPKAAAEEAPQSSDDDHASLPPV